MKTSKQTLRKKVTGRSIDPFGDDIFDIIDYYFTYRRGREDERKEIREELGPAYQEAKRRHMDILREVKTLRQEKAKKENELKEIMKKQTEEAAREAARLQKEIERNRVELEEKEALLEKSTAMNKNLTEVLYQSMWTFRDDDGGVLVSGKTKGELALNLFDALKKGGDVGERVFARLKKMVALTGPANPTKDTFENMIKSSKTSKELGERWAKVQPRVHMDIPIEQLIINRFNSLTTRAKAHTNIEKYIRSPDKIMIGKKMF